MDVEYVHEAFDLLCRAAVRLDGAFAPLTLAFVLRGVLIIIYVSFEFTFELFQSTKFTQSHIYFIVWLATEVFSLLVVFLSADFPANQVRLTDSSVLITIFIHLDLDRQITSTPHEIVARQTFGRR